MRKRLQLITGERGDLSGTDARPLRILAVGDLGLLAQAESGDPGLVVVDFHEVTAETLAAVQPDVVLSPLVFGPFDCFDLAAVLSAAGFLGRYRAAAGQIPSPGLVRREIAASFPELDFDVVVLSDGGGQTPL